MLTLSLDFARLHACTQDKQVRMKRFALLLSFAALVLPCAGQQKTAMRMEDKVRIREAETISRFYGENIWKGISKAPFAIILVDDSVEFLINHPSPSKDFRPLGYDSLLSTRVYHRKAVFDKHFLATFPAVNGVNTIVVGTPENTGKTSTDWIITLLHEHFHQFVNSSPGYYSAVNELDLSRGDQSGMWMLNYPFPYADTVIAAQYKSYSGALSEALSKTATDPFSLRFSRYVHQRKRFQELLKPADYRYYSFQIWQEGIARYTEYKFLDLLNGYEPSRDVSNLPDFIPFETFRESFYKTHGNRITAWSLGKHGRECFYAVGLGEGLILDRLNPSWREKYLTDKFYLEHYAVEFERQ